MGSGDEEGGERETMTPGGHRAGRNERDISQACCQVPSRATSVQEGDWGEEEEEEETEGGRETERTSTAVGPGHRTNRGTGFSGRFAVATASSRTALFPSLY